MDVTEIVSWVRGIAWAAARRGGQVRACLLRFKQGYQVADDGYLLIKSRLDARGSEAQVGP